MNNVIDINEPQRGPAVVESVDSNYATLRYDRPPQRCIIDGQRVPVLDRPDRTFWIERVKRSDLEQA